MSDWFTLSGTGHRAEGWGDPPVETWLSIANAIAAELIRFQHQLGKPLRVWGGAATGFDTWLVAGAILARRATTPKPQTPVGPVPISPIQVGVIRPFRAHQEGWPLAWKEWEQHCWNEADFCHTMDARRWDYDPRNRELVGVAARASGGGNVWSGWDGRRGSGTSKTIGYALDYGLTPDNRLYDVIREVLSR